MIVWILVLLVGSDAQVVPTAKLTASECSQSMRDVRKARPDIKRMDCFPVAILAGDKAVTGE
jgi:hypothetical protein